MLAGFGYGSTSKAVCGRRLRHAVAMMIPLLWNAVASPEIALAQEMEWELKNVVGPSPRRYHAMAYDSARRVTVLFGGFTGSANGETWEWDGSSWTQRQVAGPSPRWGHAMAYDSARRVTVLFGGFLPGDNGETWEWDGTVWTQRAIGAVAPSPRRVLPMAYDAKRGEVVLFGGESDSGFHADTWVWNGDIWSRRDVIGPSPRSQHAMVYDSLRETTVLVGGLLPDITADDETWEWNGAAWSLRANGAPGWRQGVCASYDSVREATFVFGGTTSSETWRWNGVAWATEPATGPSWRFNALMAFDIARSETVMFGGGTEISVLFGETWVLRGCAPVITSQPASTTACPAGPAAFSVTAANREDVVYQWQYRSGAQNPDQFDWTNLVSGVNPPSGAFRLAAFNPQGSLLVVDHDPTRWPDPSDRVPYQFRCLVSGTCGSVLSDSVDLAVTSCDADFNGDCFLDFFDYDAFVLCFESEVCDGSSADFNRDGFVDFFDYDEFVAAFELGC